VNRKIVEKFEGWEIYLNRNVHMYSHKLVMTNLNNKKHNFVIPCEDLADEKGIYIDLGVLKISSEEKKEIAKILMSWTKKFSVLFKIYISSDDFYTNK